VQTTRQVAHSSEGHVYAGPLAGGYWIDAADLRAGDRLLNDDSSRAEVVSSRTLAQPLRAYNLTVKDFHTYFVAANKDAAPVWVHNWCLSSKIKRSPLLIREAQRSGRNIKVQEDIDRLTAQLRNGNLNPGIGSKPIGSGISEARGANGGRVYFRVIGETVEILGKSGKGNQSRVIREVMRIWGR